MGYNSGIVYQVKGYAEGVWALVVANDAGIASTKDDWRRAARFVRWRRN